jgi:hypothetical protein
LPAGESEKFFAAGLDRQIGDLPGGQTTRCYYPLGLFKEIAFSAALKAS